MCLHFRNLFSDYTNITVQLRPNHATLQFTLMFLMLPHSPFFDKTLYLENHKKINAPYLMTMLHE